jgi:hypothetical protein
MVDNTADMNKLVVGYNPGDFFYSTVENAPDANTCKTYLSNPSKWSTRCNESNLADNKLDCVKVELCKNSQNVKTLYDGNKRKSENHERNLNTLAIYRTEYITMWNLGMAIVGLLVSAYYLFWGSNLVQMTGNLATNISSRILGPGSNAPADQGQTDTNETAPPLARGGRRR